MKINNEEYIQYVSSIVLQTLESEEGIKFIIINYIISD